MTNIRIKSLKLENFKCHRYLKLDLDGRNVSIYGDNATGKTSVYDALTWLLFGKDSSGNGEKNIDIKPLNASGSVADHGAITSVEAVLSVAGEVITLKRTYREVWSTKRGSSAETYDGNTSEYFVDGVPCKKYVFESKIKELLPEDVFRLLTSVEYFPSVLSWQNRRTVLFDIAGTHTDREIMAGNAAFVPLLEEMGKLTLDDFKKKLVADRKGLSGIRNETPARLNELSKTVSDLEGLDFAGARTELAALEEQRKDLGAQLITLENDNVTAGKRLEIRELQLQRDKLTNQNQAFRDSQKATGPDLSTLQRQHSDAMAHLNHATAMLTCAKDSISTYERKINAFRERWITVKGEAFSDGKCPTCGQALPFEQLRAATEQFEKRQADRLREIEQTAQTMIDAKAQSEKRVQELETEISHYDALCKDLDTQMEAVRNSKTEITDMDGYAEQLRAIDEKLMRLNGELSAMVNGKQDVKNGLSGELADINTRIKELQDLTAKESMLEYTQRRITDLQEDARAAATKLESIEKMLFLIEEYTRHKARYVEDSVNRLFRVARFRLFREQANGGLEERCDVVCGGVPYTGLNNGAKINVGIDIINTLSRHFGVSVPLFIDNAESVTRLECADTQVIRLVVSESDAKLRCEYEN